MLIYVLDYDRTPGIVEGVDVVCFGNGYLKELSPITDPPSPSLVSEMSSQRNFFIKVEDIESTLLIALPRRESRAVKIKLYEGSCAKEVGISPLIL